MIRKLSRLIYTIKEQKPIQLIYRIKRKKRKFTKNTKRISNYRLDKTPVFSNANFFELFDKKLSKLWSHKLPLITYHLNYFDNIHTQSKVSGLKLINDWIDENNISSLAWDPYPTSLRLVNWFKFIANHNINNKKIENSLYRQAEVLFATREYHLLTNHLFKNIVAMLYAGIIFENVDWKKWAIKELFSQIKEQLTEENYHFELSPTYHALFTFDLLDIYNLLKNNRKDKYKNITRKLETIIPEAIYWCDYFSRDDRYYAINDVNYEGCPTFSDLEEYCENIGLDICKKEENQFYPSMKNGNFELLIYLAEHQPKYNPAHSHDDLSSFLMWHKNKAVIVDTGNYCYDESTERSYSRSTKAHNCFTINDENQSDMWKSFRIAKRAKIISKKVTNNSIEIGHDGYKQYKLNYKRLFNTIDKGFEIIDSFECKQNEQYTIYLHFHPDCKIDTLDKKIIINNEIIIEIQSEKWEIIETEFYPEMFKKEKKKTLIIKGNTIEKSHKIIIKGV
jgi:uncharacterized heparinase superfamily protein